ncbi:hypothetical protein [Streptomyces sp. NPDC048002]|uniref:hypothetical protein n=1 Tax=Streptomyces sp. NPDC048002 TaxID=3154344 RepID=UPI0034052015
MNVVKAVPRQAVLLADVGAQLMQTGSVDAAVRVLWETLALCDAAHRWDTQLGDGSVGPPLHEAQEKALAGAAALVDLLKQAGDPSADILAADLRTARARLASS